MVVARYDYCLLPRRPLSFARIEHGRTVLARGLGDNRWVEGEETKIGPVGIPRTPESLSKEGDAYAPIVLPSRCALRGMSVEAG